MIYYLTVALITVLIAWVAVAIWRRLHDVSFLFGIGLIYYWTFFGSWGLIYDARAGNSATTYSYLFDKLFEVTVASTAADVLADPYFETLLLYGVFVMSVSLTVLCRTERRAPQPRAVVAIDHRAIIAISSVAGVASYAFIAARLNAGMTAGVGGYIATRTEYAGADPLYNYHKLLLVVGLAAAGLGAAVAASGSAARLIVSGKGKRLVLAYPVVLAGLFIFCFAIGNRHELLSCSICSILFFVANCRAVKQTRVIAASVLALVGIQLVEMQRGMPFREAWASLSATQAIESISGVVSSNESVAAHVSLYGVIAHDVPKTYGSSFVSLASSAIPRAWWSDRPGDIYQYYSASVSAVPGQGYTIHHATGWYLNLGVAGVVVGGFVFGAVWAACFNARERVRRRSRFGSVLCQIAPSAFVGAIPTLLRAGPEGYKSLIFESLLFPALVLCIGARTVVTAPLTCRTAVFGPNGLPNGDGRETVKAG